MLLWGCYHPFWTGECFIDVPLSFIKFLTHHSCFYMFRSKYVTIKWRYYICHSLCMKSMQIQSYQFQDQMGASTIHRSQKSIQGCINKSVMFVTSTLINSSTHSRSVGIVRCFIARLIDLTRMQTDNIPALWSTSYMEIHLLGVGRYSTRWSSSCQMSWRSSFLLEARFCIGNSIKIKKGKAERNKVKWRTELVEVVSR